MVGRHSVIAVNDVGAVFAGPLLAWASLHPDKLLAWRLQRSGVGPRYTIAPTRYRSFTGIDFLVPDRWAGSSGLYAVQVALEAFKFTHVVCCGVPMLGSAGHMTGLDYWPYAEDYQRGWLRAYPQIASCVRSMSGWTRELLGSPSEDWFKQEVQP
jgi:hypothetical protein